MKSLYLLGPLLMIAACAPQPSAPVATAPPPPVQLLLTTDTPGVILVSFDPATDLKTQQSATAQSGGQASQDVALQSLTPKSVDLTFPAPSARAW